MEGVPIAERFLDRFNLKSWKKAILFNVANHMIFHDAFTAMKNAKAVDFMEGKFEPDGDSYIRKPGLHSCMNSIYDYIVVCIADVAGRVKDPSKLPAILYVVLKVVKTFEMKSEFKLPEVVEELTAIIGDSSSARNLAIDLIIAAKHKLIMEKYTELSKDVKCSLDIEDLKEKYQGEKLGYMIHKDKRIQRVVHMKNARHSLTEFMYEMEW
jgi:tRNA nucleotidyltransferase (CCA-adding enzyme)